MSFDYIQIVPRLPPAVCGVGDYANNLALALKTSHDFNTFFIVTDPQPNEAEKENISSVTVLKERNPECLFQALMKVSKEVKLPNYNVPPVLLQLSPYGYENNGCPYWLLRGLLKWKEENKSARILTMFHELYAFGAPWKKSFWVSPFQRMVTSRLAQLSDIAITSMQAYALKIDSWDNIKRNNVSVFPVFSNIGEPDNVPQLLERKKRLIIFGKKENRLNVYKKSYNNITNACEQLEISEIIDIGEKLDIDISINNVIVREMGRMSDSEISTLMSNSIAGFIDYPQGYLAKSGIFAAYCSHGMIPIIGEINHSEADSINAGKEYWVPSSLFTFDLSEGQIVADNARKWYSKHRLQVQVAMYASKITK